MLLLIVSRESSGCAMMFELVARQRLVLSNDSNLNNGKPLAKQTVNELT